MLDRIKLCVLFVFLFVIGIYACPKVGNLLLGPSPAYLGDTLTASWTPEGEVTEEKYYWTSPTGITTYSKNVLATEGGNWIFFVKLKGYPPDADKKKCEPAWGEPVIGTIYVNRIISSFKAEPLVINVANNEKAKISFTLDTKVDSWKIYIDNEIWKSGDALNQGTYSYDWDGIGNGKILYGKHNIKLIVYRNTVPDSTEKKMYVISIKLKSITFNSDHNVLTDKTDNWDNGGKKYKEPEWTKDTNNPITHTKNTNVQITTILDIKPEDFESSSYTLKGEGPAYLTFNKSGTIGGGLNQSITITTDANTGKLPDKVTTLLESISWTINYLNVDKSLGQSGAHKIYVTYSTPGDGECTEKRMSWDCSVCNGKNTLSGIADAIYDDFDTPPPYFQLGSSAPSPLWLLMTGSQYKGECIDLANLMKLAVELIGGTASIGFVYGSTDTDCFSISDKAFETRICGNILSGEDGIADTSKQGDDIQVIPKGKGEPNTVAISAGKNGRIDTIPFGNDKIVGNTITTGNDGICNTKSTGDDIQIIKIGKGKPNTVVITAGPDGNLQTTKSGDDKFSGHGEEVIRVYSAGGWNNWEAVCECAGTYYAIQIYKGTPIEILRYWLGDNRVTGNYQAWRYYDKGLKKYQTCTDPGPCPVPKP